jgi:F-box protein 21
MDPFHSTTETPVSDLQNQLNFLGTLALSQSTFLSESLTGETVLRCGKNILNSIRQTQQPSSTSLDIGIVKYAALWASMLFTESPNPGGPFPVAVVQLIENLPWMLQLFATEFPEDVYLIEQHLVPLFHGLPEQQYILETVRVMRAGDEMPRQVRRRTAEHKNVKYRIGQVFRHRRYEYRAIIIGWDAECGAGEQWMQRMGIDRLQAGRYQSFYHVL